MSDNYLDGHCRLRRKLPRALFASLRTRRCNLNAPETDEQISKSRALYCECSRHDLLTIDIKIQLSLASFTLTQTESSVSIIVVKVNSC